MNKLSFISAFVFIVFLGTILSCKKDISKNINQSLQSEELAKDSNFVSISLASTAAKQITNSHLVSEVIQRRSVNSLNLPTTKTISDTIALPTKENPSYYIFNYAEGGFVILAADKRVEPVLAFSDHGHFKHSGKLPFGLINWLSVNHQKMQALRKLTKLKAPKSVTKLWNELSVAKPSITSNIVTNNMPLPPPCEDTYISHYVGPYLQTTWAQGPPYNALCPSGSYWYSSNKPAGCVATAVAQLMYYWQRPTTYNWSIMPLTSNDYYNYSGNAEVAQLFYDIGSADNMQYHDSGSNPDPNISISQTLRNSFGYGAATDANFNYLDVMSNLNYGQPVILSAATGYTTSTSWFTTTYTYSGGHTWVCDGYLTTEIISCPEGDDPGYDETLMVFDMNWGWNEEYLTSSDNVDGWYNFAVWNVQNGTVLEQFQYDQTMTYNIHP